MKHLRLAALVLLSGLASAFSAGAWAQNDHAGFGSMSVGAPKQAPPLTPSKPMEIRPSFMVVPRPKKSPDDYPDEFPIQPPLNGPDPESLPGIEAIPSTTITHSFNGIAPGELVPPDCTIAAGPSDVLVAINDDFRIYDRQGNQIGSWDINTYLNDNGFFFDPKVMYDRYAGRFYMIFMKRVTGTTNANSQAGFLLMVSNTNRAQDGFYFWNYIDVRNGASEWLDYAYIGSSSDAIAVGGTSIGWFGVNAYQSRLLYMPKAQIVAAQAFTYYIYTGFTSSGTDDDSVTPTIPHQNQATMFVVNTKEGASDKFVTRKFTSAWPAAPSYTTEVTTVAPYSTPPDADQPDTANNLSNFFSPRLMGASSGWGYIHATHHTAISTAPVLSAARTYRLNSGTNPPAVIDQTDHWAGGLYYFYPQIIQNWLNDRPSITFARSGASEYGSMRMRTYDETVPSWPGSVNGISGTTPYAGDRWGDYFGISQDPWDDRSYWAYGQYAVGNNWQTRLIRYNQKPVPSIVVNAAAAQTTASTNLSATYTVDGSPVSGITLTFRISGSPVGSAVTNGSGVATLAYTVPLQVPTLRTIGVSAEETTTANEASSTNTLTISKANTASFGFDETFQYAAAGYFWGYLWRTTDNTALTGETLIFKIGGTTIGTLAMGSSWVQLPYTMNFTPGAVNYTVEYAGNSFYNSSVSTVRTNTITKANTTLTLANASGTWGQSVNLQATLRRGHDNAPISGRTVQFKMLGFSIGTAVTNASGVATLPWVVGGGGTAGATYPMQAVFEAADAFYNPSSEVTANFLLNGKSISGNVNLLEWNPSQAPIPLRWEAVDAVSGAVYSSGTTTQSAGGNYSITGVIMPTGNVRIRLKSWHWLSNSTVRSIPVVGVGGVNMSLLNGDCNDDNEVGAADFSILAAAYDSVLGDAGFNPAADLNGDEEVGAADFSILAANYDEVGS